MKNLKKLFTLSVILVTLLCTLNSCKHEEQIVTPPVKAVTTESTSTYAYRKKEKLPEILHIFEPILTHATVKAQLNTALYTKTPAMEVTDLQGNKTYSILLPLKNTSDYEFYNWVIEQKSDGTLSTPYVKKYTTPYKKTTLHKVVNNTWMIKTYTVGEFLSKMDGVLKRGGETPCSEVTINDTQSSFSLSDPNGTVANYFSPSGNLIKHFFYPC
ncbi:hypothetical protein ACQY1Q_15205 [Tenacibaculum sp. TC6]|uniref:hypothetical protein n=1 Tax=Tenacibaculum sp. TC6 TaxID=3423223 RepID=UPI003D36BFB7